jgi:hypothetical protein
MRFMTTLTTSTISHVLIDAFLFVNSFGRLNDYFFASQSRLSAIVRVVQSSVQPLRPLQPLQPHDILGVTLRYRTGYRRGACSHARPLIRGCFSNNLVWVSTLGYLQVAPHATEKKTSNLEVGNILPSLTAFGCKATLPI